MVFHLINFFHMTQSETEGEYQAEEFLQNRGDPRDLADINEALD
jgi:hypothetical protein